MIHRRFRSGKAARVRNSMLVAAVAIAAFASAPAHAAGGTIVASPGNLQSWVVAPGVCGLDPGTSSVSFEHGPDVVPNGAGSAHFALGANGASFPRLVSNSVDGTRLDALSWLVYRTYVGNLTDDFAPAITLGIDQDGDTLLDDRIVFQPRFSDGTYNASVPTQGPIAEGVWQRWDAMTGAWWSTTTPGMEQGSGVKPLSHYLSLFPDAEIAPLGPGLGGLMVAVGCNGPTMSGYEANVDRVVVGVGGVDTVHDFEPVPHAPVATIDSGDAFVNAAEASSLFVKGTYDPTRGTYAGPAITRVDVQIPDTGASCIASVSAPILTATLDPTTGTWIAGPFDVSSDVSYAQNVALCARARSFLANGDGSTTALSLNNPVKDTVAPAAPTVTLPSAVNASNASAVGVGISGEEGATANISLNDTDPGTPAVTTQFVLGSGPATVPVDISSLTDGLIEASVTLTDPAGNTGAAGTASTTMDATAPNGSVAFLNQDGFLNTEEANRPDASAIKVQWVNAHLDIASTSVRFENGDGSIPDPACGPESVAPQGTALLRSPCALALDEGEFFLKATWTDGAGNTFTASASMIKDTSAPDGVTIDFPAPNASFAPGTDITVTGTGPANTSIRLTDSNGPAIFTTSDETGAWAIPLGAPAEGPHTLLVSAVDEAGNRSAAAFRLFTINRTIPVITGPSAPVLPGIFAVTGTGRPGALVELFDGSTQIGKATVTSSGNWSQTVGLATGTHVLRARGTDTAGNVSAFSPDHTVLVDAGRPTATITTTTTRFMPGDTLKFDGSATDTGPAGFFGVMKVEVEVRDAIRGSTVSKTTAACTGCGVNASTATWTVSPGLGVGMYSILITTVDLAGNRSNTASLTFTVLRV